MNNLIRTANTGILSALLLMASSTTLAAEHQTVIAWQTWSPEVFEQAAREKKLVLLDLEAVWCHWCHVMDQKTYANENVAGIISEHFIAVKVDHDARPDLANRYRNYGWPATIVFTADGSEIVKRAGYIAPERMARLLLAVVYDPSPERATNTAEPRGFAENALLSKELYDELIERHKDTFDWELGGYKSKKKTLDRDSTEYALVNGARGDQREGGMARLTIDASMALIDPEWGGAYQYSTRGDWDHAHFEKTMAVQAGFLRIYTLAYLQWQEPRYLQAALDMERYLADFLTSPDGAYYTSQDADLIQGVKGTSYFALSDRERRKLGLPRVDKNIYARENGWAVEAVTNLYQATGNKDFLDKAVAAAEWVVTNRSLIGGGYRHASLDRGGPYLADTLNMGRAFLQLYRATGARRWLSLATSAGSFIDKRFRQERAGFLSGVRGVGPVGPVPNVDENVSATRFLNLLAHYTGNTRFREAAEHGMRYLATADVATRRIEEGGILLAALELASDPSHFTVIGTKDDPRARALYDIALKEPGWYKRIEWWDVAEGPLPNPDVRYPTFEKASAFVCTDGRCSLPAFSPDRYFELISRLSGRTSGN